MALQTKFQCMRSHDNFLSDHLKPGFLGKLGNDIFLHTCTERVCGTRLSPKNHATVETARAWVLSITVPILKFLHIALICAVDAPCAVCPRI